MKLNRLNVAALAASLSLVVLIAAVATSRMSADEQPTAQNNTQPSAQSQQAEPAAEQSEEDKIVAEYLKTISEAQGRGAILDPKIKPELAERVGKELRAEFPYKSLRERLKYETRPAAETSEPKLSPEAAKRLEARDASFALMSKGHWHPGTVRVKSLEKLHSDEVASFISRSGFGLSRMPTPSPGYLHLPPSPTIPFAAAPDLSESQVTGATFDLPAEVTNYDLYRLHAKDESLSDEEVQTRYYKMESQDRLAALAAAYDTWRGQHNPLNLPSRQTLQGNHDQAVYYFASGDRNGHVKDVDHVAGFASHALTRMPQFVPGPYALRFWPHGAEQNPPDWLVSQLQLVSLLKHDVPGVYVSQSLPKMEELAEAKVRPLDAFEAASLKRLVDGEDMAIDAHANRIRMLGAVRASKRCVQCHQVKRGELLGAFSYELVRTKPIDPPKRRETPAG